MYNGPVIRPDPAKINKGRRKKIRIPMVMDEMKDHINELVPTEHDLDYQCVYIFIVIFIRTIEF
jgi:predicted membrane GTPase involved in stress response